MTNSLTNFQPVPATGTCLSSSDGQTDRYRDCNISFFLRINEKTTEITLTLTHNSPKIIVKRDKLIRNFNYLGISKRNMGKLCKKKNESIIVDFFHVLLNRHLLVLNAIRSL